MPAKTSVRIAIFVVILALLQRKVCVDVFLMLPPACCCCCVGCCCESRAKTPLRVLRFNAFSPLFSPFRNYICGHTDHAHRDISALQNDERARRLAPCEDRLAGADTAQFGDRVERVDIGARRGGSAQHFVPAHRMTGRGSACRAACLREMDCGSFGRQTEWPRARDTFSPQCIATTPITHRRRSRCSRRRTSFTG